VSMIAEKTQDYFSRYPQLRTLFFFDEQGTQREEVLGLSVSGVRVASLDNNAFTLKTRLATEWRDEKVLVYVPHARPADQKAFQAFPLLGEMIAGKVLELSSTADFMETFALPTQMRSLIHKYMGELQYKQVQAVCAPLLSRRVFEESPLQRALISAFLDFKRPEDWQVLSGRVLIIAHDADSKKWEALTHKLEGNGLMTLMIDRFAEATGLPLEAWSQEAMETAAQALRYNQITLGLPASADDPYQQLNEKQESRLTSMQQLLTVMEQHGSLKDKFERVLRRADERVIGQKLIEVYGIEAEFAEYTPSMVWKVLSDLVPDVQSVPESVLNRVQKNSTLHLALSDDAKSVMKIITGAAKCAVMIEKAGNCIWDRPDEYIAHYTESGYAVDQTFRHAVHAWRSMDQSVLSADLITGLEALIDFLNVTYEAHLERLNREWLKCFAEKAFAYENLTVPLQRHFYADKVADAGQKVAVIVSDALRYEVGQSLLSELHKDAKNTATMGHMLACIPSRTSVGMAMLLPGEKAWTESGITAAGISTESTHREQVLQSVNANSAAIQAKTLLKMKQDERREIFKQGDSGLDRVVYIYHDLIDSTGDKRASEDQTFRAVEDAVEELQKLIGYLHATLAVAKVYVTADHGFLYNDRKLKDTDLETHPLGQEDAQFKHNRWGISGEKIDLGTHGYSVPIANATGLESDLYVHIPASTNRYRHTGVGHQFVHGGGSLQELIVPLIESSRKVEEISRKVGILIPEQGKLKVVSSRMKLTLIQADPVSHSEKPRNIFVALMHQAGHVVSNQEEVLLDSTAENPSERSQVVELTLTPEASSENFVKLRVWDTEDSLNALAEITIPNQTLIQPDF